MEQSLLGGTNIPTATHVISHHLWNQKAYFGIRKTPLLAGIRFLTAHSCAAPSAPAADVDYKVLWFMSVQCLYFTQVTIDFCHFLSNASDRKSYTGLSQYEI